MIPAARLLHSSAMTYLPSNLPAQFYGLPDGKIYIVYGRFYDVGFNQSGVEYVFAVHQEFSYNYEEGRIIPKDSASKIFVHNNAIIDNQNPKIKIIKTYRKMGSFSEAFQVLNRKAIKILHKKIHPGYRLDYTRKQKINSETA